MSDLFKNTLLAASIFVMLMTSSLGFTKGVTEKDVLTTYADIAHAGFEDALITAMRLNRVINTFVDAPTEINLKEARRKWLAARIPYQQTEVFRFGNAIVDDWEWKVNAWPLDAGLVDYVDESDKNPLYTANVIANSTLKIAGKDVDATKITRELLKNSLQVVDEIEASVVTGYHAVEFLLWGQDLHGKNAGAGERKASDYDAKNCTNGNCDRRAAYLKAVTELLVDDLAWMTAQWDTEGVARLGLLNGNTKKGLSTIFTGMGNLSYGELGGERMKLGIMLQDTEEEHDCFSDNTHNSHFFGAKGIQNIYYGYYKRLDGTVVKGASISDLVAANDTAVDRELKDKIRNTMLKMTVIVRTANRGEAYDQMIAEGNVRGNKKISDAVNALTDQTKSIEKAVNVLNLDPIKFESPNKLDTPEKV